MNLFPSARLDESRERRWSVAALVAANLLPLFGVLFFGWKTYDVVLVYWLENVAIGVLNLPRMALAWASPEGAVKKVLTKLVYLPFFCFHYGLFCTGHGAMVVQLLAPGGDLEGGVGRRVTSPSQLAAIVQDDFSQWQWLCLAAFATSHLVSFFVNYLGHQEWRRWKTEEVMFLPYGRVILLHIAILIGGVISLKLGSPIYVLVLLVAGKTLLDLAAHQAEHQPPTDGSTELVGGVS